MFFDVYFYITVFLGLCFGSFATALSYRLPRGLSMITMTRSACPSCRRDLQAIDLFPLFSWLLLRGKCRRCHAPIGARYPMIELATLLLCIGFYAVYGFGAQAFVLFALASVLVSIIDIDLHHKIIPDSLNLSVFLLGVAALFLNAFVSEDVPGFLVEKSVAAGAGAFLYALGSWLLRYIFMQALKREPMGLGDVKFFAAAGFWMGLDVNAVAWFLMLSGGLGVVLALLWKKISGEDEFPFGPALVFAFAGLLLLAPEPLFLIK